MGTQSMSKLLSWTINLNAVAGFLHLFIGLLNTSFINIGIALLHAIIVIIFVNIRSEIQ